MAARLTLADLDPGTREALAKGIAEFNNWRFYDCHETLEDVWREVGSKGEEGTLADFYQGIIKIAARRIGGTDSFVSQAISLRGNSAVRFTIESNLNRSSVGVW